MEDILHQLIGSLSHSLQGFMHPRWCRISSINSINWLPSVKGNWNPPSFNRRWHLRKVNTFCWPILVDIFWVPPGFKKTPKNTTWKPQKIGGLFYIDVSPFPFRGVFFRWTSRWLNQPGCDGWDHFQIRRETCLGGWRLFFSPENAQQRIFLGAGILNVLILIYIYIFFFYT